MGGAVLGCNLSWASWTTSVLPEPFTGFRPSKGNYSLGAFHDFEHKLNHSIPVFMTVTVLGSRKVASFCVTNAWRWDHHFSAPLSLSVFSKVSEGDILQTNKIACCSGEPAWTQSYKSTYFLTFKAWWRAGWVPSLTVFQTYTLILTSWFYRLPLQW